MKHPLADKKSGKVVDLIHAPGKTCPVAKVDFGGNIEMMIAAEGMMVGQKVMVDGTPEIVSGNIMPLANVPEGTLVFNVEGRPGDGWQVHQDRRNVGNRDHQGREGLAPDAIRGVPQL